ncbi:unnamed protein product [Adineta steineri]|uniref:Malonyl-CoA:ACP transacylase (MAT) domain-containing protein n=1 Tax=Adineta steineri TaxID=433720 RepID=A0A819W358_9BILA|nr:unnamed protein product [Adineta steineri]
MTKINNGEWRLLEELIEKKTEQESRINDTNIAQPTLFAIQVALAALLVSWNIYPSFIISHSAGDQAAAFVAGCLSLEEAVCIEHLACIAVVNSPRRVTISGDEKTIDEIQQILSISYPNIFEDFQYKIKKQIFDPICAKAKLYSSVIGEQMNDNIPVNGQYWWSNVRQAVRFYDAIAAIIKDEVANVFLEIPPHPVLATSIRECYELTNQQQSPLILPTLKRKEDEQITLLTSLAQLTTSSHVWQQYFHTCQILPLKNHEEYFDNFPSYKFYLSSCWYESKDSSIQRLANRMPAHPLLGIRQLNDQTSATWKTVAYLELATAAWTIQDIRNAYEHLPTRAYQYGSSFQKIKTLRGTLTTIISQLSNDNHNCSSYYLLHPYLVILPGVETTFLPVRIQKFIYSSVQSGRWSIEKTIYDKLNLTTDLPNTDHKTYLDTIIKDYLTWNSTHLRLIQLIERFPRLKSFLIILSNYGLHLKDILSGEKNGLDIFLGDEEIAQTFQQVKTLISATKTQQIFHSICQHLQLKYKQQQQTKNNSFENYRLRIFWLTDSHSFKQNKELLCGILSRILQTIKKLSYFYPFVYVLTNNAQFNNDSNHNIIASLFIGLARIVLRLNHTNQNQVQYLTWHYEMLQNNDEQEKSKLEQISIIPKRDVDQKPFRICVPSSCFPSELTWIEEDKEKELLPSDMVD